MASAWMGDPLACGIGSVRSRRTWRSPPPFLVVSRDSPAGLRPGGARVARSTSGQPTLDSACCAKSLRPKKGQLLDQSMLNEDIKTLYDLFATVAVETKQEGDEVTITFVVTENALAATSS